MEKEPISFIINELSESENKFDYLFNSNCEVCGNITARQDSFYRLNFIYCSSKCVQDHKKSLDKDKIK